MAQKNLCKTIVKAKSIKNNQDKYLSLAKNKSLNIVISKNETRNLIMISLIGGLFLIILSGASITGFTTATTEPTRSALNSSLFLGVVLLAITIITSLIFKK